MVDLKKKGSAEKAEGWVERMPKTILILDYAQCLDVYCTKVDR